MSTIRKLPYIEKALANLNETQATEAISYLNGAGVETALGWDDLGDEALLAFGHFEPFGTGLLVSDPNGSTAFIAYSTNAQTLREYDLDIESKTAKEIVEGLTIEELRRVLKDKTSSGGGTIDAETLAGLLDASEGVIADLNEAGDKVELHLEETVTTDATLSLGTNTDGDPTIVLGYKKPDGTELTSPVSLDKGAFNVQNNHVGLNGVAFDKLDPSVEYTGVTVDDTLVAYEDADKKIKIGLEMPDLVNDQEVFLRAYHDMSDDTTKLVWSDPDYAQSGTFDYGEYEVVFNDGESSIVFDDNDVAMGLLLNAFIVDFALNKIGKITVSVDIMGTSFPILSSSSLEVISVDLLSQSFTYSLGNKGGMHLEIVGGPRAESGLTLTSAKLTGIPAELLGMITQTEASVFITQTNLRYSL